MQSFDSSNDQIGVEGWRYCSDSYKKKNYRRGRQFLWFCRLSEIV